MQIKEVEKLTGLTAKSIRFYEEKGLLDVARQENNTYRDYSKENLETLKRIKIFRYFGFSITEISNLLTAGDEEVAQAFKARIQALYAEEAILAERRELCQKFSKHYTKPTAIDDYNELIDFRENEAYEELRTSIEEYSVPSIWASIVQTVIALGPILNLFERIHSKQYDQLSVIAILSLLSVAWLIWIWSVYFKNRRVKAYTVKKKNKKEIWLLPICIVSFGLVIAAFLGISWIIQAFLLPHDWLFYEMNRLLGFIAIFLLGLICTYWLMSIFKINDFLNSNKWRYLSIAFAILVTYVLMTNVIVVTPDQIITYSPTNLKGTSYPYQEIDKIEVWYGHSRWPFDSNHQYGNFYYAIWLDGKRIIFSQPNQNNQIKRFTDAYQELEEFDQRLVDLGIPKEASDQHAEKNDYDEVYQKRFSRIIQNK